MIRDKVKNDQYFSIIIERLQTRAHKYESKLSSFPSDSVQYEKCQIHLNGIFGSLISALYSGGATFSDIKPCVRKYLDTITPSSITYNDLIDSFSLAILFEEHTLSEIILKQDKYHDALLDTLKAYVLQNEFVPGSNNTVFDEYQPFLDYALGNTELSDFVRFVEESWYDSCSHCAWYESHNNPNNVYVGYWCWIAAALLKMKGVPMEPEYKYIPIVVEAEE